MPELFSQAHARLPRQSFPHLWRTVTQVNTMAPLLGVMRSWGWTQVGVVSEAQKMLELLGQTLDGFRRPLRPLKPGY